MSASCVTVDTLGRGWLFDEGKECIARIGGTTGFGVASFLGPVDGMLMAGFSHDSRSFFWILLARWVRYISCMYIPRRYKEDSTYAALRQ